MRACRNGLDSSVALDFMRVSLELSPIEESLRPDIASLG